MITVAVAGLGNRGVRAVKKIMNMPDRAKVVAIATRNREKLDQWKDTLGIPEENVFSDVDALLEQPKLADVIFICTQDRQHVPQAIVAMEKGYDVLLEKPISPHYEECKQILEVQKQTGRKVVVCHVLRYAPFMRRMKEIIGADEIGDIVMIEASENISYMHQAHSYVRGNSRNSEITSPVFLQKCCHDMDYIVWLTGRKCERLSSFGSLVLYQEQRAPEGSATTCLGGCKVKQSCPYDAEKLYITDPKTGLLKGDPVWSSMVTLNPTVEKLLDALKTGPYGRCVYHCDNNVVDHQIVNMEMEGGIHVSFTMDMVAEEGRQIKIMGSKGTLYGDMDASKITVIPYGCKARTEIVTLSEEEIRGHAGADDLLIKEFFDYIEGQIRDSISALEDSAESHFMCMAAEESRLNGGKTIIMSEFR